jgi:Ni/Co efflux regulator RcnB
MIQQQRPPINTQQVYRPPVQGGGVQGPRAYVPNQGYQPQSRSFGVTSGSQGQRSFGSTGVQGQPRTFGSTAAVNSTQQRHFGVSGASGQRTFGTSNGQPRTFGSTAAVDSTQGRHFGAAGGPTGRGLAGVSGGPRRSASGRTFAYNGHTFARFAGARYRYPHGFGYHRYLVGHRFPHEFWVHDYYIADYADYDLAPPPDDYQWIRYGPDIVLVDLDTGEIAQIVYGVFDEDTGPPDGEPDQAADDQPPPDGQN